MSYRFLTAAVAIVLGLAFGGQANAEGYENLSVIADGEYLMANTDSQSIDLVSQDGTRYLVPVSDPGGIAVDGDLIYYAGGNNITAALTSAYAGSIFVINRSKMDEGSRLFKGGILAPNGLAVVGHEVFYTSIAPAGMGLHSASDGRYVFVEAANGLAASSDGMLYVSSTLGRVYQVDPDSFAVTLVADLQRSPGIPVLLDDLTVVQARDGRHLYVASPEGAVWHVGPTGNVSSYDDARLLRASSVRTESDGLVVSTQTGAIITLPYF